MDKKLLINLLLWHTGIVVFSIILANLFSDYSDKNYIITSINILLIVFFYFLSGYINTKESNKIYDFFSVFYIGLFLWLIGVLLSPNYTNYKRDNESAIWLLYELYVFPKFIFYEFIPKKYSLSYDLFIKLFFPFIFSLFQYVGGLIKVKR